MTRPSDDEENKTRRWMRNSPRQTLAKTRRLALAGCPRKPGNGSLASVRNKGPWKNIDDLEIAVAEYIDRFNHRRLYGEIGLIPPVEVEDAYYRKNTAEATAEASVASLY